MVAIKIEYVGNLHCQATHAPSGSQLTTDAPADNMGKGEAFSPTDLVATALGTCILTVMGTKAQSMDIDLSGSTVVVEKEMASGPRRIGRLATSIVIPHQVSERDRKVLEAAAFTCPVHKSMSPDVEMPIAFEWAK
ncbi:OsmC family protein [Pontixanthobacter aquaemixtae]|uniref:OsmC family peroxiredoxin n=1 Tax=Pontixanthobacter aquaemixtae TaxID=1958940 RepID=A0A844ZT36_9SPHN|nr:OsmC family protein [Pontixanthobacter aquaemixtae]MXO90290.1 OsmC family peroxiredoxin [Pontixanthobacter aquaemixtae]